MRAATRWRALVYTTEDLTWKCRNLLEISHEKCKPLLITAFVTREKCENTNAEDNHYKFGVNISLFACSDSLCHLSMAWELGALAQKAPGRQQRSQIFPRNAALCKNLRQNRRFLRLSLQRAEQEAVLGEQVGL